MKSRLEQLRDTLKNMQVDGFIQPMNDEYMGEYVPKSARRLPWLTGFTGSAGAVAVLADKAAVFTDGRYTLQLAQETDSALYERLNSSDTHPSEWLAQTCAAGARIGYDARLFTPQSVERYRKKLEAKNIAFIPLASNPIDAIWTERPAPPAVPVTVQEERFTGESSAARREKIAAQLREHGCDALVLTLSDSIAWLLNIRGGDVPYTPFALSFAIMDAGGRVRWFIDRAKISDAVKRHLGSHVAVELPDSLETALAALGKAGKKLWIDPTMTSAWFFDVAERAGAVIHRADDPCQLPKACKNPVELDGMRAAHRRDGVAVVRFLSWLDRQWESGAALDEMSVSDRLKEFRAEGEHFRGLSFPTIAGFGPNGAIVHYRATAQSNRTFAERNLFLLDSGAQYLDGTTDITRTIAVGAPTQEMKECFTRVLKGHIALARAVFPAGTTGSQLDVLARRALWEAGLDYDHGTGHGVGSYLSVHEGPQRISKSGGGVALQPGMILSTEPGYYKAGAFGIRIENLVAVVESAVKGEKPFYAFETLTQVPIDTRLVERSLLSDEEAAWLNAYHAGVKRMLEKYVNNEEKQWLELAAAAI
ncbi:MAG: aminopeptidase P family protein [Alphaproteobacteria bacterium]|nr:aminopeptidase P family protein [Alphaproteobacteria bacterium]